VEITSSNIKLKPRRKTSHKGQNGIVTVIGGSEDYVGAPALVGMSALAVLRSGADLVHVIAPEKTAWAINCIAPDIITHKLPGRHFSFVHVKRTLELIKHADVVVIGNGITLTPGEIKFVKEIIKRANKPLVIDAAALRITRIQDVKNAVLLPHAGELETLLKNSKLTGASVQKTLGTNILVKKGHPRTEIISKRAIAINKTGHAGMTHGGTGDVLAGIIAALIAQGNEPYIAACAATYVNGKTAESLSKELGFGYLASDFISALPRVLKKFQHYSQSLK